MDSKTQPSRRGFMLGAAVAGTAAAAVATLPQVTAPADTPATEPVKAPERGGGYRLSEHVLHYYQTTRI